jgi:hypothetical protein
MVIDDPVSSNTLIQTPFTCTLISGDVVWRTYHQEAPPILLNDDFDKNEQYDRLFHSCNILDCLSVKNNVH